MTGSYVCLKCFSVLQLFHTLRRTALQTEAKLQDYEDAHPERRTFSIADVLRNDKVRREEAALEKAHTAAIEFRNVQIKSEEAHSATDVAKEIEKINVDEAANLDKAASTTAEPIVIDASEEDALEVVIDFSSGEEETGGDCSTFEVYLDMEAESEENLVVKEENEIKIETKTSDSWDEHSN